MTAEGRAEPDRGKKIGFIGWAGWVRPWPCCCSRRATKWSGWPADRQTSAEILAERLGCPALDGPEVARRADVLFLTTSDDAVTTVSCRLGEGRGLP